MVYPDQNREKKITQDKTDQGPSINITTCLVWYCVLELVRRAKGKLTREVLVIAVCGRFV